MLQILIYRIGNMKELCFPNLLVFITRFSDITFFLIFFLFNSFECASKSIWLRWRRGMIEKWDMYTYIWTEWFDCNQCLCIHGRWILTRNSKSGASIKIILRWQSQCTKIQSLKDIHRPTDVHKANTSWDFFIASYNNSAWLNDTIQCKIWATTWLEIGNQHFCSGEVYWASNW